jgi:hypothetical protein
MKKKPMAKKAKPIKKAQLGRSVKPSADSTDYFGKKSNEMFGYASKAIAEGKKLSGLSKDASYAVASGAQKLGMKALDDKIRQSKKGKPGYDEHGRSTFKPKSPKQQISEGVKKKMKSGGTIKAKAKKK